MSVRADVIASPELSAWRIFQRAHVTIARRLEAELNDQHDLSVACFDVLQQLAHAQQHRLRMNHLAERVLLSRSGLTRLVDRLEREGLVERHACGSDARGLYAVLTGSGQRRLAGAVPTYYRCIRECFLDRIGSEELQQVAATASKLTEE